MTTHLMHRGLTAARLDLDSRTPRFAAALGRLNAVAGVGLDVRQCDLVWTHASTINGCAYRVDMHAEAAVAGGESGQRITGLGVWRETDGFYEVAGTMP